MMWDATATSILFLWFGAVDVNIFQLQLEDIVDISDTYFSLSENYLPTLHRKVQLILVRSKNYRY